MTSRDFCYWLQGYFEITAIRAGKFEGNIGEDEIACIRNHLAMVFKHEIDPSMGDAAHQAALSHAHQGGDPVKPPPFQRPIGGNGPGGIKYRC